VNALGEALRELAEAYLYNGDTDQPLNEGYEKLLSLADDVDYWCQNSGITWVPAEMFDELMRDDAK
jgi:uncharacterized HAD superfamily protein